jgi:hypothetical protein
MGKIFGHASPRLDDTAHILLTVCACLRALHTIIPSLHLHCPELGPVTGYRWAVGQLDPNLQMHGLSQVEDHAASAAIKSDTSHKHKELVREEFHQRLLHVRLIQTVALICCTVGILCVAEFASSS